MRTGSHERDETTAFVLRGQASLSKGSSVPGTSYHTDDSDEADRPDPCSFAMPATSLFTKSGDEGDALDVSLHGHDTFVIELRLDGDSFLEKQLAPRPFVLRGSIRSIHPANLPATCRYTAVRLEGDVPDVSACAAHPTTSQKTGDHGESDQPDLASLEGPSERPSVLLGATRGTAFETWLARAQQLE